MFRALRKELAQRVNSAAAAVAPRLPEGAACCVHRLMAAAGSKVPLLARMVEENLRSAGLFTPAVHRAYFAEVALHFANGLRIFRAAKDPQAVARLAAEQVDLHDSINTL